MLGRRAGLLPDPYQGRAGQRLVGLFEGLRVSGDEPGQTVLVGPVADQAALHGLLAKIRELGLLLLKARRRDPD